MIYIEYMLKLRGKIHVRDTRYPLQAAIILRWLQTHRSEVQDARWVCDTPEEKAETLRLYGLLQKTDTRSHLDDMGEREGWE